MKNQQSEARRITMTILKRRAKEPSSHAGLALLAQAMTFFLPECAFVFHALTIFFGTTAISLPEAHWL